MTEIHLEIEKYKGQWGGQWGGKIASGEEMWWSEPRFDLRSSLWKRFWFRLDPRHYFILRFWKKVQKTLQDRQSSFKFLDYGCGTGGTTLNFSMMIGYPITGLDIFETQLQIAGKFSDCIQANCHFKLLVENEKIPEPSESVDVVFSLDVLGHVPHIPSVLKEWSRVLKKGGAVLLFTESTYSQGDRSVMAQLARAGADMMAAVPEHISLFPKETLEEMFSAEGFEVKERFSANVMHFLFFPKDYVLMLKGKTDFRGLYYIAWIWNRISKVMPFYPWPFHLLRLGVTRLWGEKAYGTSYFYFLVKK